jgi:hypothetical protein
MLVSWVSCSSGLLYCQSVWMYQSSLNSADSYITLMFWPVHQPEHKCNENDARYKNE